MSLPDLSPLSAPLQIRGLSLKNRLVMAPMQRCWADGLVPREVYVSYFQTRVRHGIGLAITEATAINHPSATSTPNATHVAPEAGPLWRRVTDAVHGEGGHIFMQLTHEGAIREEGTGFWPDFPSLSPSGIRNPGQMYGRAATVAELAEIRDAFVDGARFAVDAGFDGVELQGAHGYLLHSFLGSATNRRSDRYGGATLRERARYPAEVVRAIRDEIGPDVPISYRISQWSRLDFSATVAGDANELRDLVTELEDAGVDLFHCSTRRFYDAAWPGSNMGFAGQVSAVSSVPVIAVGSVGLDRDVFDGLMGEEEANSGGRENIEQLLSRFEAGEFDLIAVGRSVIADAEWAEKLLNGRHEDIRVFSKADLMREY